MLDQWLKQRGVSFRKASLIRDKKERESWGCLPVCSFIKPSLTETSQLGLFFHPTQWRAPLFAKVSAPGAGPRSQSHGQKQNRERQTLRERHRKREKKMERRAVGYEFCECDNWQELQWSNGQPVFHTLQLLLLSFWTCPVDLSKLSNL